MLRHSGVRAVVARQEIQAAARPGEQFAGSSLARRRERALAVCRAVRTRVRLAPILLRTRTLQGQERAMSSAMSSKSFLHCLYLIGVAALVVGCGPDSSDRQGAERGGGAQGRPGDR